MHMMGYSHQESVFAAKTRRLRVRARKLRTGNPENPACSPEYPALLNQNTEKQPPSQVKMTQTNTNSLEQR